MSVANDRQSAGTEGCCLRACFVETLDVVNPGWAAEEERRWRGPDLVSPEDPDGILHALGRAPSDSARYRWVTGPYGRALVWEVKRTVKSAAGKRQLD